MDHRPRRRVEEIARERIRIQFRRDVQFRNQALGQWNECGTERIQK